MKKLSSMTWLLLAVVVCCPLLGCSGCSSGEIAEGGTENDPLDKKTYLIDPPADPVKAVDSLESWRKFFTHFKAVLEKPALAEEKWKENYSAGNLKLVLMKHDPEMEYIQFGSESTVRGINPDRVYEVGIVTMAAKESKGSDGFEVRKYRLSFITPQQDDNWKYAEGFFNISSQQGISPYTTDSWYPISQDEFEQSYLKLLFYKPTPPSE